MPILLTLSRSINLLYLLFPQTPYRITSISLPSFPLLHSHVPPISSPIFLNSGGNEITLPPVVYQRQKRKKELLWKSLEEKTQRRLFVFFSASSFGPPKFFFSVQGVKTTFFPILFFCHMSRTVFPCEYEKPWESREESLRF